MTVKRTWVVENKWRCDSCGTENLGRHMECQNCRNPKEKQEADVLSGPDAPEVQDPELLRLANQGANWVCEFCGGQVRNEFGKCVKNCGAPKPAEPPREVVDTAEQAVQRVEESGGNVHVESRDGRVKIRVTGGSTVSGLHIGTGYKAPAPKTTKPPRPWALIIGIGVGVVGLGSLITWMFATHEVDTKVNSIRWSYTADLHQKTLMHGEGWGTPIGSFNTSCHSKYYGDEDCHPHNCNAHSVNYECNCTSYECNCRKSCRDNKNGFSTCEESCSTCQHCSTCSRTEYDTCYDRCPVYKQWCSYDYYEWPIVSSLKTGNFEHDEHWPDLQANGPDQRLDRYEAYEVTFIEAQTGKENWTLKPASLAEFKKYDRGQRWHLKVNNLGSVTPLHQVVSQ